MCLARVDETTDLPEEVTAYRVLRYDIFSEELTTPCRVHVIDRSGWNVAVQKMLRGEDDFKQYRSGFHAYAKPEDACKSDYLHGYSTQVYVVALRKLTCHGFGDGTLGGTGAEQWVAQEMRIVKKLDTVEVKKLEYHRG